ncbi:serine/arginine repetitive matrix protein 1-like isoform X2 [Bacillus rossius redtenbacheri]|uniref:serine/arginine repetitive matrix protein 1-like isoform X2 n=1 Tax=Bacillus rossius redtenbacheri TaxID=93214 RepID=UPI002FDD4DA2
MPTRSPARTSPPGTGRMSSRRSPGFRPRVRASPERRRRMPPPQSASQPKYIPGGRGGSPSRGRERRDFRNSSPRRSRSPLARPVEPKGRGFSPPKRKLSPKRDQPLSLERERERDRMGRSVMPSRKRSRSKSPPLAPAGREGHLSYLGGSVGGVDLSPGRYQNPSQDMDIPTRRVLSERFRGSRSSSFEKDRGDRPVFRGPEGTAYDISELKKISVDIRRTLSGNSSAAVERSAMNPDELVIVRRPDCGDRPVLRGTEGKDLNIDEPKKVSVDVRRSLPGKSSTKIERNLINPEKLVIVRRPGEGSRPIFEREEIVQARSDRRKYSPSYERRPSVEEHHRVVAIVGRSGSGHRYASPPPPPRYAESHRSRETYRPRSREREHSSREYVHEYDRGYEREKVRDDSHYDRRGDDVRHEVEVRHHREELKYSSRRERSRSYERPRDYGDDRLGSDLRMRINEKKERHDDRDGHHRMLEERDHRDRHHSMVQPSPPGSDRYKRDDSRVMPPERYYHKQPMPPPPEFASSTPRPDKFYKSWESSSPEYVPKGKFYYEHDNREDGYMRGAPRGRGMMNRGMPRGRGTMRGRPFRGMGPTRGGFIPNRGMTRRGGFAPRGFFNAF